MYIEKGVYGLSSNDLETGKGSKTDGGNRENIGHVQLDGSSGLGGRGTSATSGGGGGGLGTGAAGAGDVAAGSAAKDTVQHADTVGGLLDLGGVTGGSGGGSGEASAGGTGSLGVESSGSPVADTCLDDGVLDSSRELQDIRGSRSEAGKELGGLVGGEGRAGGILRERADDTGRAGVLLERLGVGDGNEGDGGEGKGLELHFLMCFCWCWLVEGRMSVVGCGEERRKKVGMSG